MDKLSSYFSDCWKPLFKRKQSGRPSTPDASQENGQQQTEYEGSTECLEDQFADEEQVLLALTDIFEAFKSEADKSWESHVSSPIFSGRFSGADLLDIGCEDDTKVVSIAKHIYRHASAVPEIYNYFLMLDPKRCCLPSKSESHSSILSTETLMTVQENGAEPPRTKTSARGQDPVIPPDVFLNDQEKDLYKRVLLCAQYPVLSSPMSEPDVSPMASSVSFRAQSVADDDNVLSPTDKISIEPEMLMTYIRESFGISPSEHKRYLQTVRRSIPNGSQSRLLLRELQERRYQLETNQHYYYKIGCFLDRDGYPIWRSREIEFTEKLIRKFWKGDIPRNIGGHVGSINVHEEYKQLQKKLFRYEMKNRLSTNNGNFDQKDEVISVFPLSSAARKLLKEFGLRYGVCSLYRQITSLACLAENFEYCGWFFKCVTQAVFEMKKTLQKYFDILVQDECQMLRNALSLIHEHIGNTLKNARKLFPSKIPFDVVSWILEMFKAIIKMKKELCMDDDEVFATADAQICFYFQEAVKLGYKRVKEPSLALTNDSMTPRILRKLVLDLRQELEFYKEFENRCPDISSYMDVTNSVSKTLYALLLEDAKYYFEGKSGDLGDSLDTDYRDLGLAYLFSELDVDWELYIAPSLQKWRIYIKMEIKRIMRATAASVRKLVRVFIRKDQLKPIAFNVPSKDEETMTSLSSSSTLREVAPALSPSTSSVMQSETSAFETIKPRSKAKIDVHKAQRSISDVSGTDGPMPSANLSGECGGSQASSLKESRASDRNANFVPIERSSCLRRTSESEKESSSFYSLGSEMPYEPGIQKVDSMSSLSTQYETPPEDRLSVYQDDRMVPYAATEDRFLLSTDSESSVYDRTITYAESELYVRSLLDQIVSEALFFKEGRMVKQASLTSTEASSVGLSNFREFRQQDNFNHSADTGYSSIIFPSPLSACMRPKPIAVRPYPNEGPTSLGLANEEPERLLEGPVLQRSDANTAADVKVELSGETTSLGREEQSENGTTVTDSFSDGSIPSRRSPFSENSSHRTFSSQLTFAVSSNPTQDGHSDFQSSAQFSELHSEKSSVYLPDKGEILMTSSLADLLITVFRVNGFYSKLCGLLLPQSCHQRFAGDLESLKTEHEEFRGHLYSGLMRTINQLLVTYGDGILALDICGWKNDDLESILGHQLITRLREEQASGLISGCRHDPTRRLSEEARLEGICVDYCPQVARIIKFCVGEWEAISAKVCARVNNIKSLIDVIPLIELHAKRAVGREDPDPTNGDVTEPVLISCRKSLETIWKSQISILAKRVTTMFRKIVDVLWSLTVVLEKKIPYRDRLKPASVFLECQMAILRKSLCPVSLRHVVEDLWQRILKLFHGYADRLRNSNAQPHEAKLNIQLLSVCLRHLSVDAETDNKLMAKSRPILFRFRLHLYETEKLRRVFDVFRKLESEDQAYLLTLTPREILLDMMSAGGLLKFFSGANFVNSLLSSHIWLPEFEFGNRPTDQEMAISVGNSLLDDGMIVLDYAPTQVESGTRTARSRTGIGIVDISGHIGFHNEFDEGSETGHSDLDTLSLSVGFQNSPDFIYKVETAACRTGDPEFTICRVVRQSGLAFSLTIKQDVTSLLQCRCHRNNDQEARNILNTIAPASSRPKASSWPIS